MMAHRHLREGNRRDCNTAALRSMENVLKVICDARGWIYQKGDAVERLLAVVRGNGLFPDYLGGYFDNLIGAMKAQRAEDPRSAGRPRRRAGRRPRAGPHSSFRAPPHRGQHRDVGQGASLRKGLVRRWSGVM